VVSIDKMQWEGGVALNWWKDGEWKLPGRQWSFQQTSRKEKPQGEKFPSPPFKYHPVLEFRCHVHWRCFWRTV